MEKYGAYVQTYEVVVPIAGKPDDFRVKGSNLNLEEAETIASKYSNAIIRPER